MGLARFEFEVEGPGEFPIDMLRFDCCWPSTQGSVHEMVLSEMSLNIKRRVILRGIRKPTASRWASFGWAIVVERELKGEV